MFFASRKFLPLGVAAIGNISLFFPVLFTRDSPKSRCKQSVYMWGNCNGIPGGFSNDIREPLKIPWFEETPFEWKAIHFGPHFGAAVNGKGEMYLWGSFLDDRNERVFVDPFQLEIGGSIIDAQNSVFSPLKTKAKVIKSTIYGLTVHIWEDVKEILEWQNSRKSRNTSQGSSKMAGNEAIKHSSPSSSPSPSDSNLVALENQRLSSTTDNSSDRSLYALHYHLLKGFPSNSWFSNRRIASISVGHAHAAFITNTGELFCCGDNSYGQCGQNPVTDGSIPFHSPKQVEFRYPVAAIKKAACGAKHTLVQDKDGRVHSFGDDSKIQLLLGDTRSRAPVKADHSVYQKPALPPVSNSRAAVSYAAFEKHYQHSPVKILDPPAYSKTDPLPQILDIFAGAEFSLLKYRDISTGSSFDKEANSLFCGGENMYGQCGRILNKQQQSLASVRLPLRTMNTITSCGSNHCITNIFPDLLFGWGFNNHGQIGPGPLLVNPPARLVLHKNPLSPDSRDSAIPVSSNASGGSSLKQSLNVVLLSCGFNNSAAVVEGTEVYVK
ncbi:regulator of chromosome condensation (RCC1) repeat-containing protein [Cardiosporidium cionae]|uniref:Regulator of chromosome condensation (RCC1) repeat-containing protein n=1 Tax=Cardiosporidium cionae TaxID=476202 RepID=A0ABQ7J9Q7_9APIC|nr:regulator of chromosome condensation (RCC1) repeat-containing protein [Cardiosporidium cionae]|eukprot:KAF8820738.1 regulator of chromosome condensation (RCC1) repeat-containing protein [Cardiosporidium cionae]